MKKHILLILPIVAASLFSCGNNAPTTSSTGSTTTSSTQEHPTTIDPTSPYVTSTTDAATAVEIIEISEAPTKVELGVQLDPTLINLKIRLSDNTTIFRHPDYTEIDFTDKSLGDDVTCVCHYKELTKSFNLVIAESPHDVIDYSSPSSISSSYAEWSYSPSTGAKFIAKTGGNSANQALALKWDTKDTQIGIGMAKSQGKITKVKLTFSANNSYKEGEKKSQIGIYGKATPFAGLKDFEELTKANTNYSVLYDGNAEEKSYEINVSSGNFTYLAFKAIGANASYLKEIRISYDENVKPATLESISISGKPTAEIIDTEWNFSDVVVTGNFAGGIKGDLTNGCAITSLDPIPTEIKDEYTISVSAVYAHEDKNVTSDLTAQVIGPTSISFILEKPSKVEINQDVPLEEVLLRIILSNGESVDRHPTSIVIDWTGKQVGETVEVICNYLTISKSFTASVCQSPYDIVDYFSPESISSTYTEWSYSPSTGAKFIAKTGGNSANQALTLKWDTNDTQIGIGMAKSQGKITKVKLTFSANNSYKEGEKKSQVGIYGKATPFAGLKDFEALTKANADYTVLYDGNAEEKSYIINLSANNFTYLAFKAIGSNATYIKEIKIVYDEEIKPAKLESISISGKPTAEIIDSEWDFSQVVVTGNFNDGSQADLTNGCVITSSNPIPTDIKEEHLISVTATYAHESKTVTSNLNAQVIGPTSISSVIEKPSEIALNQEVSLEEVLLRINLSNGESVERHPTSITIDWTGKQVGETVEVVCNYLTVSKSFTATIVAGKTTAFEVAYGTADSKFSMSLYKKDTTNHCYTENNSTVDTDGYVQYLNTAAYWTDSPSKITVKANLGGGSTKTFDEGYELRVALLDVSGNIISNTEKTITNKIEEKTGKEYSLVYTNVANVAGVRIIHKKLSGYNTRIYGFSLEYIS